VLCRATLNRDCDGREGIQIGVRTFTSAKASQVFSDNTAIRAVFIRDPLERFLSAFLNKCDGRGDSNCLQNTDGKPFAIAIQNSVKMAMPWSNTHWNLQSEHCELQKRIHEYNFISLMQPSTFTDNAMCLMSLGNLTQYASNAIGELTFTTQVNPTLKTKNHFSALKKFYTPEAARAVMELYKTDYDLFKVPEPAWINDATGEWFNMLPSNALSLHKLLPDPDEDDIVWLAEQNGFIL